MTYYFLEPEVSGGIGEDTVMDASTHPPRVERLQYHFNIWLGDDLVEGFPCFIVSEKLAAALAGSGLGAFDIRSVDITTEEDLSEQLARHGLSELPGFRWLYITGVAGQDDIGITPKASLVVSDRGLEVLRQGRLDNCDIEEYDPAAHA